jgi:hypothetical protein
LEEETNDPEFEGKTTSLVTMQNLIKAVTAGEFSLPQ